MTSWHLYLLDCDGRLYTGISTDPERRFEEHRSRGKRAARFTRSARTHAMCYRVEIGARSMALRAEARIKRLRRIEKLRLITAQPDRDGLLAWLGLA